MDSKFNDYQIVTISFSSRAQINTSSYPPVGVKQQRDFPNQEVPRRKDFTSVERKCALFTQVGGVSDMAKPPREPGWD